MLRKLMMTAALALALATPASALDLEAMSDAERAAFGEAVREYLLENPQVLMEAIAVLEEQQAADAATAELTMVSENADAIFNDGHSFIGGNPEGDVTVVEFIDYRCSFCRRAHPEMDELVESDGKIRKIVKEFPILGPDSVEASRFAIATLQTEGPDAYAAVNDALMVRRGSFDRGALERMGTDLGLDGAAIVAKMDAPAVTAVIEENRALAQRLQIGGTPTFVVGERMVRGYLPLDEMRGAVAEVRAQ
ncbi:MAG: DsbA family protein [Pseudomonadota bacterium]